jgi:hypothetical protein
MPLQLVLTWHSFDARFTFNHAGVAYFGILSVFTLFSSALLLRCRSTFLRPLTQRWHFSNLIFLPGGGAVRVFGIEVQESWVGGVFVISLGRIFRGIESSGRFDELATKMCV